MQWEVPMILAFVSNTYRLPGSPRKAHISRDVSPPVRLATHTLPLLLLLPPHQPDILAALSHSYNPYSCRLHDYRLRAPALPRPLPISADYPGYITSHMTLLQSRPEEVNAMVAPGELPCVEISARHVKVSPLDNCAPAQCRICCRQAGNTSI